MGMVNLHRHLLEPGDVCLGGGYWTVNYLARRVELSGASSDYGRPQWHREKEVIFPEGYEGFTFTWLTGGNHRPVAALIK